MSERVRVSISLASGIVRPKIRVIWNQANGAVMELVVYKKFFLEKVRLSLYTEDASYPYLVSLSIAEGLQYFGNPNPFEVIQLDPTILDGSNNHPGIGGDFHRAPFTATSMKKIAVKYIVSNGNQFQWIAAKRSSMIYFPPSPAIRLALTIHAPAAQYSVMRYIEDACVPSIGLEMFGETGD